MIDQHARTAIETTVAAISLIAPWWWQDFTDAVNIFVPPIVGFLGLVYIALGIARQVKDLRESRYQRRRATDFDPLTTFNGGQNGD